MTRFSFKARGYPTGSMPTEEKPYRVYRGGRVKGKVPLERPQQARPDRNGRRAREPKIRRPRRRWSWKRRIGLGLIIVLVVAVVWGIAGYLAFRSGVDKANARLDQSVLPVLAKQNGLMLSNPTTMLLLGRDHENTDRRVSLNHSDSIMVLRTDPGRHRLVYLSIPRDLRVPIPGHGEDRINSAFQLGGAASSTWLRTDPNMQMKRDSKTGNQLLCTFVGRYTPVETVPAATSHAHCDPPPPP